MNENDYFYNKLNEYYEYRDNLYTIKSNKRCFMQRYFALDKNLTLRESDYHHIKNELISLAVLVFYCILEMFVLVKNSKGDPLELDPFYTLANNEVQEIVGINNYKVYFILYVLFIRLVYLQWTIIHQATAGQTRTVLR